LIDLHCHSDRSDGALSPVALIERAASRGVRALALTDHDTLDGLAEADAAARSLGIELIPGVEISVTWHGRTLHVVGLGIDPGATGLGAALSTLRGGRTERARAIAMRLAKLGIAGAYDAALRLAPSEEGLGRAHFARHLIATGHAKDMSSAFRRYLGEGKPAYVRHTWADLGCAVAWIAAAGGVAVLAHPGRYGLKPARLRTLMLEFRGAGGSAVEVVCAGHGSEHVRLVSQLAVECALHASSGSDFHGPGESWFDLGQVAQLPALCTPVWHHPRLHRLSRLQ
jgi:predicted metal-dependent phosphoesterase TrpH